LVIGARELREVVTVKASLARTHDWVRSYKSASSKILDFQSYIPLIWAQLMKNWVQFLSSFRQNCSKRKRYLPDGVVAGIVMFAWEIY
jgi:hypothetical protein